MKRAMISVLLALSVAMAGAQDFKAMLREIDSLGDFGGQDFTATYTIVSEKPGQKPETVQVRVYRRDERDQFVFLFLKPERQKGQGYLKVDDNVWFYDPESGEFAKSTIKESVQDSEARNSDLSRMSYADDYDIEKSSEGKLGAYDVWILELVSKDSEVSWQRVRLYVRKDKPLVLKEEDFSVSGRLMRTVSFPPSYISAGGKQIPSRILIVDEINTGEKSQLTLSDVAVGRLPDDTFTESFLKRAR
ncbi:MAG TPA: outer membrane lipoprotein-sorting protein [Spirochaetales bacterium]|nr:outer membrane lipoprotein-sorting protein [Spirochaetales bacterium]